MTKQNEEFNGYPLFHEVISPTLRTWNRVNVIFNIKEILNNNALAIKYMQQFDKADQVAIAVMCFKITKDGYENTRRYIMRNR